MLIISAIGTEPGLSVPRTLSILFRIPIKWLPNLLGSVVGEQQVFYVFTAHMTCWTSILEFCIFRFARIPLHGKAPCSTVRPKILILLGTCNCHKFAHTLPHHPVH